MTCRVCGSAEVLPVPLSFCDFCGHLTTIQDIRAYHAEMVAPRRELEEERFEMALREGGG